MPELLVLLSYFSPFTPDFYRFTALLHRTTRTPFLICTGGVNPPGIKVLVPRGTKTLVSKSTTPHCLMAGPFFSLTFI